MNHSQRLNEKPLTPWVMVERDGKILGGHCDCMAGLGETCSLVASMLWERIHQLKPTVIVTDPRKAIWWDVTILLVPINGFISIVLV